MSLPLVPVPCLCLAIVSGDVRVPLLALHAIFLVPNSSVSSMCQTRVLLFGGDSAVMAVGGQQIASVLASYNNSIFTRATA